jgi:hypothetical protein
VARPSSRPGLGLAIMMAFVLLAVHGTPAWALECKDLQPRVGKTGYQERQGSPRCEGMYMPVAAGGEEAQLGLISLTFGAIAYDRDKDAALELRPPAPGMSPTPLQIVARSILPGVYYRASGQLTAEAFVLPIQPVIREEKINPEALGIYGWRRLPGAVTGYMPLRVAVQGRPAGAITELLAVLRAEQEVWDLRWRVYAVGQVPGPYQQHPESGINAGRRIDMTFRPPPDADHIVLEITYRDAPAPSRFDLVLR